MKTTEQNEGTPYKSVKGKVSRVQVEVPLTDRGSLPPISQEGKLMMGNIRLIWDGKARAWPFQ